MEARQPTGERVLVVNDEPSLCRMLGEVLRAEGYQPIICTHPRYARAAAEQVDFGLAFIDLKLPEISGLELASKLKHQLPLLEVVFVTCYRAFDSAFQSNKIDACDYLQKPFGINHVRICLKRFQERQALREKVRLTKQRYFHLAQHLPFLIYVLRREFQLESVNQTCYAMLGYTPEEAVSIPNWFLERIHTEDRERIGKLFDSAFRCGGAPFSVECRLVHKKGHLVHAIVKSITPAPCERGHTVERLEGIVVDITDRVFLEKALVRREKLKTLGTISAEVAHEIRNPLVAIAGFSRRLQRKFPDLPECGIILRETTRLEKILDRVRNYLKPAEISHQECSIHTLINDCLDLLSPEMSRRGVTCRLDLDPQLPSIYGDPDILTQVFINLIRNAIEAMDKRGTLTIKTYESNQNLHIDFRNPIRRPLVKDPELLFLRLDEGGESIGLPLCYGLVKKLDGILSFAQEQNLAVFTISLPKPTGIGSQIESTAELVETAQEAFVGAEKRRHPRGEVGWPCTLRTSVKAIQAEVRDISLGGAFISCQYFPTLNETFQAVIETPSRKSLLVINEVVWSNFDCPDDEKDKPCGMGTRFTEILSEDSQFLQEMISGHWQQ